MVDTGILVLVQLRQIILPDVDHLELLLGQCLVGAGVFATERKRG